MSGDEVALAWARARAAGPLRVSAGTAPVADMARLIEPGGAEVWLVPQVPESADARVLNELGLAATAVEQPNDTARMLAGALRCCWGNPTDPPWPGTAVAVSVVHTMFRELTGERDDDAQHRAAVAAQRRLHGAGWLLLDEHRARVRLGPRVALWSSADLSVLRQLWRSLPPPAPHAEEGAVQ